MAEYITLDQLAQIKAGSSASDRLPTVDDVRSMAKAKGIDPDLAASIFSQESGGNFKVGNSPKGAVGGMQVMPGTFKMMMGDRGDPNNPWDNLEAGLRYIEYGQNKLGTNNPRLLAAGYHQGYDRPELLRGQVANTSDGLISTPGYANAIVAKMGVKGGSGTPPDAGGVSTSPASSSPSQRIFSDLAKQGLTITAPTSGSGSVMPSEEKPGILSQFGSDVIRGVDQAQGIGYGLLALGADAIGAQGARRWAMEGVRRNEAEAAERPAVIGSYKNIRTDSVGAFAEDVLRYGTEAVGENLAVMLPSIVTGGAGGLLTKKALEQGVERAIASQVAAGMTKEAAEKAVMTAINRRIALGAVAGAYPTSAGMEAGSIYNDIMAETGRGEPGIAAAYGAIAGMFDAIPSAIGVARAVKVKVTKELAEGIVKRYGKAAAGQFASEAPTELVQTIIEKAAVRQADPGYNIWSDENVTEMIDAFLKGGLAGGGFGVATQAISDARGGKAAPAVVSGAPLPASDVLGGASSSASRGLATIANQGEQLLTEAVQPNAIDRVREINQALTVNPQSPDADALRAERDRLTQAWPKMTSGLPTNFQTESGVDLQGRYALVDADDLIASHDIDLRPNPAFPPELQPRNRERAASELQVQNIVGKLNPARLGESPDVATGAPIIGEDGLVESGNARTIALKRVFQANGAKADAYTTWLADNAERFGFSPEQVRGISRPVLVRVRETPVDRAEFARQANAPTTAQMSPLEQAKADAARVGSLDDFTVSDTGEFNTPQNKRFIERFVGGLPVTEQSALVTGQGALSQSGYARIRNAVLARAYGDSPTLMRMVESLDSNLRNIMSALVRVAPAVAKAREAIAAGAMHDRDITEDVLGAVEELSRLRTEGTSVADYLAQSEMFGSNLSPEGAELLQFLDDNIRAPRKIAAFIENYLSALAASGSPNQGSLLGETEAPSKQAIINAAKERTTGGEDQDAVAGGAVEAPQAGAAGEVRPDAVGSRQAPENAGAGQKGREQPGREEADRSRPAGDVEAPLLSRRMRDTQTGDMFGGGSPAAEPKQQDKPKPVAPKAQTGWSADLSDEARPDNPIPRSETPLDPDQQRVEERFRNLIWNNLDAAVAEYRRLFKNVINTDNARELSADYDASKESRSRYAAAVHEPASFLVKEVYKRMLREATPKGRAPLVAFTAGGTGAGKTTGMRSLQGVSRIVDGAHIVFDTNMNGLSSSKTKIDQALAAGHQVYLVHTFRDPMDAMINGALPRAMNTGRTVPISAHMATHLESAQTVKALEQVYRADLRVEFLALDNSFGKGNARAVDIDFAAQKEYDDLHGKLVAAVKNEYQAGRISEAVYRGTIEGADDAGGVEGAVGGASGSAAREGDRAAGLAEAERQSGESAGDVRRVQKAVQGDGASLPGRAERRSESSGANKLTPAQAGVGASGDQNASVRTDRRTSAEGQVAGSAQGAERERGAARVRDAARGGNLFGDQPGGPERARDGGLGQQPADVGSQPGDGASDVRGAGAERPAGVPDRRLIPQKTGGNHVFTDAQLSYEGSWYDKAEQNVEAIELVKALDAEGRKATPEEQAKLARYIGFGASDIRNALWPSADGRVRAREPRWQALRDRLEAALDKDELDTLRRSTQYAHYTSKEIVRSIWAAFSRMGFKGGSIIEPGAGIGIFPGLLTPELAAESTYTGIEFDKLTGSILRHLFPDERVLVESFVDSQLPKGFYDIAVGNPPFANIPILSDAAYKRYAFPLHDYFFAKTIYLVKPGGLMVFISSRYTMDKGGEKLRKYMARSADLVGAIRLPQTAFKKNAGTEVVTDVIVFRKRREGEQPGGAAWQTLKKVKTEGGDALINEYFVDHPEMVLGTHALDRGMYRDNEYTVLPKTGAIEELFARAVERLPENIFNPVAGSPAQAAQVRDLDYNPKSQKEGNYYVADDGRLLVRENGVGVPVQIKRGIRGEGIPEKHAAIIKDFVALRDALKQAHYDQLNDGDWEKSLAALQKEYRRFVKAHGRVNQFKLYERVDKDGEQQVTRRYPLIDVIDDDPDYTRVMALEKVNEETGAITESAFLSERVLNKPKRPEIRSISDALLTVLNERGRVDIGEIASTMRITEREVIDALGPSIYEDPSSGWQTADEYLSGDVKAKLKVAQESAKHDRRFERNVDALLAVQPTPIRHEDINISLGVNWVQPELYEQFLKDTAGVTAKVEYVPATNTWMVEPIAGYWTPQSKVDWGTEAKPAHALLEHALTKRPVRVTKLEGTGKDAKRVTDAEGTEAANEKLAKLKGEFRAWVWRDPDRALMLADLYNEKFNTTVPRQFDGRHLTLPGTSSKWKVHEHVKRGAWRIVQRGNTYLAHAVGAGKTFESIIGTQEQKRLGLIQKPMFVVPNHMLQQFAREFQDLYPAAKLMVADEKQFHTDRRRRFVARVALSDLDGVIITHSAFKLLDTDPEFKKQMIEEQLDYFRAALEAAGGDPDRPKKSRDPKIRQIEAQIERLEEKLKAAMSSAGKDRNVLFTELGVDQIVVDEAHEFRKLAFATSMQVKGVDPNGSDRAFDLWMKTRWLEEKNPGRSLIMMSGTPITNTLAELFTVQRFMNPDALAAKGLSEFDAWASMFGQETTELEPNAVGGYEPVTRFSSFVNIGELVQMFREFADVLTSSQLGEILVNGRPKVRGGTRKLVLVEPIPELTHYLKTELDQRLKDSRAWKPSPSEPHNPDPVINIITDGRLAAIDMRFINPVLPPNPGSKLNKMIDEIIAAYQRGSDIEYMDRDGKPEPIKGATQMVFSDVGFGEGVAANRGFDARAWLLQRLAEAGIPRSQIAFMSDYKKSEAKLRLFRDMNSGKVRILVGSSKNMGTGVNAQQRLLTLHHLDTPWYPADLEQREGRIIRFGNKNKEVELFAYATRGGYDSTMWQLVSRKQKFIEQALSGDSSVRVLEDISESSNYAMAAAMTAGDQRAIQLAGLQAEVQRLERLRNAHHDQQARLQRDLHWAEQSLQVQEARLPDEEAAAAKVEDLSGQKFRATVGDVTLNERKLWGEAILAKYRTLAARATDGEQKIGEVSGFDVIFSGKVTRDNNQQVVDYAAAVGLVTPGGGVWLTERPDADPVGLAMRAVNAVESIRQAPARTREQIKETQRRIDAMKPRIGAAFEFDEVLRDKMREMDRLEVELAKGDPATSRATSEAGLSLEDAESVVLPLIDGVKNLAPGGVHVVERADQLPARHRDYLLSQNAMDETEGLYDPDTKAVYLISRNIDSQERAQWVLWHELYGHYGLRGVFGAELNDVLGSIWARNANVRRETAKLSARFGYTNYLAIEEALANIAGDGRQFTGMKRLMAAIQTALRARGWNKVADFLEGMTDAEALALLATARRFVTEGKQPHLYSGKVAPALSRRSIEERPGVEAAPGDRIIVYRVGDEDALDNRNAGNADSVARHLLAFDDFESPSGANIGSKITAFEVEPGEFGKYEGVRAGKAPTGSAVGRSVRGNEVAYSFPQGGSWSARLLASVPLAEVRALLESRGYGSFDDAGTIAGANAIRDAFSALPLLSRAASPAQLAEEKVTGTQQRGATTIQRHGVKFAPVDAATRAAVKITQLHKVTGGAYDRLLLLLNRITPERVKAGVTSDYAIPEALVDQRAAMQGRLRKGYREVEGVVAALGNLTRAESRVAYEWANADNPDAAEHFRGQLPEESIQVLAEVEKTIDQLSEEAVRLGQLSPEVRDRNRFAYLHRSYVKHTAELTEQEKVGRRRAIAVLGEQYKGRGIVDSAPMRQIQNVAPGWWKRKLQAGKADKALNGEKFIRFERRAGVDPNLTTDPLSGMGPSKQKRKLLEVQYWPASEPVPAKYGAWDEAGTWEARDTKGADLVLWRDFTKSEREELGEIDEIKYAVAKTLHGMIHDIEVGKYLEHVSQNYATASVSGTNGNIVKASESLRTAFTPDEWVQVPDTTIEGTGGVKRYGKLAGKYLPAPIWNDVRQVVNFRFQPWGEMYSKILTAWKVSKTALSPAVHMNNVMANMVMADWHDVRVSHIAKALSIVANKKDPVNKLIVERFEDSGGAIGTYSLSELQRETLEPLLEELRKEVGLANQVTHMMGISAALHLVMSGKFREAFAAAAGSKPAVGVVKAGKAMIDLYQTEDVVFRLAAFLKAKEEGATDQEAGKFARKSFLDYHINAPWIQMMRSTAFPFISFVYRAFPMLLETAARKPWKMLKLGLFFGALNAIGYAATGGDEDKERKLLPEEKAGKIFGFVVPKLVRMPWNDDHGSPVFLDVRRWIPVGDIVDLGATHSAIPLPPAMIPGGPLAILAEAALNKVGFTGKEITKDTDTPGEKAVAVADHLFKAFAPNLPFLPGTYSATGIWNAASGKTDAFGREQSTAQAVSSSVGVKLGSYPEDVLMRNQVAKRDSQLREISERQAALRREYARRGINAEEFEAKMGDQAKKREKVQREFAERVR